MTKVVSGPKTVPLWLYVLLVVAITIVAYMRVISSEFISWDDSELLLNNKDVQHFDIGALFTRHYAGNYLPVTMLLYALDWSMFQASPVGHHLCNVLLHCLNGVLVFILTYHLFRHEWKALACMVIFCLHPLQVEPVAWVAEAKTLVCTFFFLLALIFYVRYLHQKKPRLLFGCVLPFFLLALLSKPAAICLPLCMLCIDLVLKRPMSKQVILEKIPFLMLAFGAGLLALYTQQQGRFINTDHLFSWYVQAGYAGYAMLCYLGAFILPMKLSVIYPYPQYAAPAVISGWLFLAALAGLLYLLGKRKKMVVIGLVLFILSHLLLVLQLVPFGEVLTADRYMYLAVIGFSWLLLHVIRVPARMLRLSTLALALVLGVATFARTKVWQNSITLYKDILETYPGSYVALNSLGAEYMIHGNTQMAYDCLDKAITNSPAYYKGYYNRGLLNSQTNRTDEAINDLTKAIGLKPYAKAYIARANVYYQLKDLSKAVADANAALLLDPTNIKASFLLASCYEDLGQLDKALQYYNESLRLNPAEPGFYLKRAIVYGKRQDFEACLNDLNTCIGMQPDYAEAYYWRGVAKVNLRQQPCSDFKKAYESGFPEAYGAMSKYCR